MLYHFLSEKYALSALEDQQFKVSHFDNLNDPFELLGGGSGESEVRAALRYAKQKMSESNRLLCCSKSWVNTLLWSHYSDRHRGIALILEVPEEYIIHIKYTSKRKSLNAKDLIDAYDSDATKKYSDMLLSTKYSGWSYENEARLLISKKKTIKLGALEFVQCSPALKITGLILGPLSTTKMSEIESRIPTGQTIKVITSRLAFNSFRVVQNKNEPTIELHGE